MLINKKNYKPDKHKDSHTLTIKNKEDVFYTLECITSFLRVDRKRNHSIWILENYDNVMLLPEMESTAQNYYKRKLHLKNNSSKCKTDSP